MLRCFSRNGAARRFDVVTPSFPTAVQSANRRSQTSGEHCRERNEHSRRKYNSLPLRHFEVFERHRFWISKTPITVGACAAFFSSNQRVMPKESPEFNRKWKDKTQAM